MNPTLKSVIGISCAALLASGCTDDKYDLSDLDKDVQIRVNDLVVPVNIDKITLKSIFDIEEGDRIQEVDGVYAVIENNTFTTDPIKINAVTLNRPTISPSVRNMMLTGAAQTLAQGGEVKLLLESDPSHFSMHASEISADLLSITEVGTDLTITIKLTVGGFGDGVLKSMGLRDVVLQLPKGLYGVTADGNYDKDTGLLALRDCKAQGSSYEVVVTASRLNISEAGAVYNYGAHTMLFADDLRIAGGALVITPADLSITDYSLLPSSCTFRTDFALSELAINTVTGRISYTVSGINIPSVDLTNLPDVLSDKGTDIRLANPQLYLRITNPVGAYGTTAQTGLDIKAQRDGKPTLDFPLPAPFEIIADAQPVNYCLSPSEPSAYYSEYPGSHHVAYPALSNILSPGEDMPDGGLPGSLAIDLISPCVDDKPATDLPIGRDLGPVSGNYTFYAPIELAAGSRIVYTDRIDGWSDDDVKNITVQTLVVTAVVDSDLPFSLDFTGYPINPEGKRINNVDIVGADVPAGAKGYPVTIRITGEVRDLDGIEFTATARPGSNAEVLKPSQSIHLSSIRPKVSGYYNTTL